jgi:hypothetical protein
MSLGCEFESAPTGRLESILRSRIQSISGGRFGSGISDGFDRNTHVNVDMSPLEGSFKGEDVASLFKSP